MKKNEMAWRWKNLCTRLGIGQVDDLFEIITTSYGEPHRRYHVLVGHIGYCLKLLDEYRAYAENPNQTDAIEFALLMHDLIYHTYKRPKLLPPNEMLCAAMADDVLVRSKVSWRFREKVAGLIVATTHLPGTANTDDEKLIADIDWSPLGCSWKEFEKNGRDIRYEYSSLSDEEFRDGREKFFASALQRQSQFYLKPFRDRFEAQAVANLRRALDELRCI